jgi:hypothetical protein
MCSPGELQSANIMKRENQSGMNGAYLFWVHWVLRWALVRCFLAIPLGQLWDPLFWKK